MKDHISICICTFHRNTMLERLLLSLLAQETGDLFDLSIVVVDNDSAGPARETVAHVREQSAIIMDYDIEAEQTIPAARNRALGLARGNYIGILDDDEFAPSHWLITLYRAIQRFEVDGALGPVYPFFSQRPPQWILRGRFCERPVIRTGTQLNWTQTRTGNVLLKRDVFDRDNLRFDLKWKTSGSDRAFFREAIAAGRKFIAVEEAPVYEKVPPERWKSAYYLRRAFANGYNAYRSRMSQARVPKRLWYPIRMVVAIGAYVVALPFAAILGTHLYVKCLESGGHHLSQFLAMLGIELVKKRDF